MYIILYITIPSVIVLLTAYFLLDRMLKAEEKRRDFELRKSHTSVVTPLRLRAYERLALVLERTSPQQMVIQVIKPGMTNLELHTGLLESIRQEFDHNAAQQIYISNELWLAVKSARESLIQLINTCSAQFEGSSSATELGERILQVYASSEETPGEMAIKILKNEVRNLF